MRFLRSLPLVFTAIGSSLPRDHWQREIATLDPEVDYERIVQIAAHHEFPWDLQQALSFALFRTYAVPTVGRLLFETGAFTADTQRRHDDTVLLLDAVASHGVDSPEGHAGIRRINQMHGAYDISNDDMIYVLSTFVVVPARWIDSFGWRPASDAERLASVRYYQRLGELMGIKNVPADYDEFATGMDEYENEHFAYEDGSRTVADATLALVISFYPAFMAPVVRRFALSMMDAPLLHAFDYQAPPAPVVLATRAAMKLRAKAVGLMPARREPKFARDVKFLKTYPDGFDIENLGTFPAGCPVPHGAAAHSD